MLHEKVMSVSLFSQLLAFDCTKPSTGHCFHSCHVLCIRHLFLALLTSPLHYGKVVLALYLSKKNILQHLQYTASVWVCVWKMGQQWLGTSRWWSFKAYCYHCMQAKHQSVPDQTVHLSLWNWCWEDGIFIHQTYRALFKQHGSPSPWKCFVEIHQWYKFSLLSLL